MAAPGSPRSGKNRVARVMKINGIAAKTRRKFKITTVSRHAQPAVKDLVNRVLEADPATSGAVVLRYYLPLDKRGSVVSVGDSGCLLSPDCLKDPCDRLVDKPTPDQGPGHRCFPASRERQNSKSGDDLAFRPGQSLCQRWVHKLLEHNGIQASMGSKGDCYDNTITESFFHTLKTKLVYFENYQTREEVKSSVFEYIEVFYSRKRRHSALGYETPVYFENNKNNLNSVSEKPE